MIRREGARLVVSGAATLATVAELLEEGNRHLREGVHTVDLAEVKEIDSSLLAALLSWSRESRAHGAELQIENMPSGLATIARLYGVHDLLAAPAQSQI